MKKVNEVWNFPKDKDTCDLGCLMKKKNISIFLEPNAMVTGVPREHRWHILNAFACAGFLERKKEGRVVNNTYTAKGLVLKQHLEGLGKLLGSE